MTALTAATTGSSYEVKWLLVPEYISAYLNEYGIRVGSRISVVRRDKDYTVIGNQAIRLILQDDVAKKIQVG